MKLPGVVAIHHPDYRGVVIIEKGDVKAFINKNLIVWEKNNIDSSLFIIEEVDLKSKRLQKGMLKEFPELFL